MVRRVLGQHPRAARLADASPGTLMAGTLPLPDPAAYAARDDEDPHAPDVETTGIKHAHEDGTIA